MDPEAYLQRIGYGGPLQPTARTLNRLHRAHMYSVPFENLDISLGRPLELSLPYLFDKIVNRRRGGFCYELNALFGWLLWELGFRIELLSGRVFNHGKPGPEFDHMLLLLDLDGRYIADVGFGDSFVEPLPLGPGERDQGGRSYRVVEEKGGWVVQQRVPGAEWESQYAFSLTPRRLDQFEPMCRVHQTSPDSAFRKKSICSLATGDGRITLTHDRLIVTDAGGRRERTIANATEYRTLLETRFGVDLGDLAMIPLPAALQSGT